MTVDSDWFVVRVCWWESSEYHLSFFSISLLSTEVEALSTEVGGARVMILGAMLMEVEIILQT